MCRVMVEHAASDLSLNWPVSNLNHLQGTQLPTCSSRSTCVSISKTSSNNNSNNNSSNNSVSVAFLSTERSAVSALATEDIQSMSSCTICCHNCVACSIVDIPCDTAHCFVHGHQFASQQPSMFQIVCLIQGA